MSFWLSGWLVNFTRKQSYDDFLVCLKKWSNFPRKKISIFLTGKVGNCVVLFHHTCFFWLGKVSHALAPEFVRLHFACEAPNSPRGAHHGLWSKLEDLSWTSSHGDESIGKHNSKQWEIHYVDGIFTRKKKRKFPLLTVSLPELRVAKTKHKSWEIENLSRLHPEWARSKKLSSLKGGVLDQRRGVVLRICVYIGHCLNTIMKDKLGSRHINA